MTFSSPEIQQVTVNLGIQNTGINKTLVNNF